MTRAVVEPLLLPGGTGAGPKHPISTVPKATRGAQGAPHHTKALVPSSG